MSPLYIGGTGESTRAHGLSIRLMQADLMVGAANPESIGHIITKGAVATSLERIKIEGSDHHGLIADITLS